MRSKAFRVFLALAIALAPFAPSFVSRGEASTGCGYPASLDTWSDKVAGDFWTVADVNQARCAIEKLESGPLRPNKVGVAGPAFSFQGDTDTGVDSTAADTLDLITGGASRATIDNNLFLAKRHLAIDPFTTGAGNTGQLRFKELAANGANYVGFKAPDLIGSDVVFVLPSADGAAGNSLQTDGAGNLSFGTGGGTIVLKTADETVNNSNVLQNDDHLFFSAAASSVYFVELYLLVDSSVSAVAGWKFHFTGPAGFTAAWGFSGADNNAAQGVWTSLAIGSGASLLKSESGNLTAASISSAGTTGLIIYAMITTSGTSGTVNFQWSQNTANASNSIVKKNSFMKLTKLS
jgi:hypothetical protein